MISGRSVRPKKGEFRRQTSDRQTSGIKRTLKESTAAPRWDELARRAYAVNHCAVADCIRRGLHYFPAQGADKYSSVSFGGWYLWALPPLGIFLPRHK